MATDGEVSYWDGVAYNAIDFRQLDSPLLMPGPTSQPFSGRSGRQVNNSGLAVTVTSTGNGSVSVSAGAGVIYDSAYPTSGAWRFAIPTAISGIALAARPGAGTSRIDLVIARIYDSGIGVGAVKEVKIEVFAGAAVASPVAPALPALSFELARLTVTSTSGGAITKVDSTQVSVAAGGILPVATTLEMDALKTASIAYRGLVVDNAQTGALHRYNGSTWPKLQEVDDTGWLPPTLGTGWVHFGAPRAVPRYRRLNGVVYAKGMVKNGAVNTILTLPSGFRLSEMQRWDCPSDTGTASIDVDSAGNFTIAAYKGGGSNGSIDLSTIRYIAEA